MNPKYREKILEYFQDQELAYEIGNILENICCNCVETREMFNIIASSERYLPKIMSFFKGIYPVYWDIINKNGSYGYLENEVIPTILENKLSDMENILWGCATNDTMKIEVLSEGGGLELYWYNTQVSNEARFATYKICIPNENSAIELKIPLHIHSLKFAEEWVGQGNNHITISNPLELDLKRIILANISSFVKGLGELKCVDEVVIDNIHPSQFNDFPKRCGTLEIRCYQRPNTPKSLNIEIGTLKCSDGAWLDCFNTVENVSFDSNFEMMTTPLEIIGQVSQRLFFPKQIIFHKNTSSFLKNFNILFDDTTVNEYAKYGYEMEVQNDPAFPSYLIISFVLTTNQHDNKIHQ